MSHSLHPHTSMGYQRPSPRAGAQQRDRDRQLLEDAVSLYLSSAQPSFRHRGAAALPAAPYYEDLDFPLEYGEDYTLQEQPSSAQRNNKKVPQDYSSLAGLDGEYRFKCCAPKDDVIVNNSLLKSACFPICFSFEWITIMCIVIMCTIYLYLESQYNKIHFLELLVQVTPRSCFKS